MEFTGCRGVKGLVYLEDIHFLFRSLKSFNCCLCFTTLDLVSMRKWHQHFWRKKKINTGDSLKRKTKTEAPEPEKCNAPSCSCKIINASNNKQYQVSHLNSKRLFLSQAADNHECNCSNGPLVIPNGSALCGEKPSPA